MSRDREPLFNDGKRTHILVEFIDIPDIGRSSGWVCHPFGYKDGDPIGFGSTMREAFCKMLDRMEIDASEARLRQFGQVRALFLDIVDEGPPSQWSRRTKYARCSTISPVHPGTGRGGTARARGPRRGLRGRHRERASVP